MGLSEEAMSQENVEVVRALYQRLGDDDPDEWLAISDAGRRAADQWGLP